MSFKTLAGAGFLVAAGLFLIAGCGAGRLDPPDRAASDFSRLSSGRQAYLEEVTEILTRLVDPLADMDGYRSSAGGDRWVMSDADWRESVVAARTALHVAGTDLRGLDNPGGVPRMGARVDDIVRALDIVGMVSNSVMLFADGKSMESLQEHLSSARQAHREMVKLLSDYCE